MPAPLERLSARTNGCTVTPRQYLWFAYAALVALTLIVLTGAAVRLTGSGLGCPTWPKCYGNVYPPLHTHALIEFSNRVLTAPVCLAAGLAWLAALRRRPYRRELTWLAAMLPLGVIGQAVLGGLTVKGRLDYGWVMGHFALSMLILVAAVTLAWRARGAREEAEAGGALARPGGEAGESAGAAVAAPAGAVVSAPVAAATGGERRAGALGTDRTIVRGVRALVALGALTIFAGTAATAAGPHAGGEPGQKINRLDFDGRGTMDFVIHRHAEIAFVFSLAAVALWWLSRRRPATAMVRRSLTVLCALLAVQGAVGLDQYETHLPTELVWVHVALASTAWISTLWACCAAGRLAPRSAMEGVAEGAAARSATARGRPRAEAGEAPAVGGPV
ncbi:MAG TPA: COX15/CtaA family protein [Solirubrobacteraceae bacterium]|nr:COX15/CtaA family protein [Solirubrobacteraceae bacterium]